MTVDWTVETHATDTAAIAIEPLHQSQPTAISTITCPFYIDSGATTHISPDRADFLTLYPIAAHPIRGVGGSSITAIGCGDIKLRISRGNYLVLRSALFVPNAAVRLVSASTLIQDSNATILLDKPACYINNKSTGALIAQGTYLEDKRLWSLDLHTLSAEHTYAVTHAPTLETWHRRLGHANYQVVQEMARKGMVTGMPASLAPKASKCESCVLGKQTRTPVPKKRKEGTGHRATRRLEKVWVDLSSPVAVTSRCGYKYAMNIIDDFSSYIWTILLPNKAEAFQKLKIWETARKTETGLKIGIYHTDNGELKSN
ncbi:hypothetical protein NLJ89_g10708 [Agrocybe chaxingu]|uniref:Integrase catalytic domain-containing protein n=1 Tax=Agrocybe chaxingu TaxID=84603 RepID=A0A9W8MNN4_9AGAR|nr:hypothetical protein NLJ89_g10708 [Agrocybe chaxingu]